MRKILRFLATTIKELFWLGAAVGIVAAGVFGFQYLGENREVIEVEPQARSVTPVETIPLEPFEGPLPIRSEGFIEPFRTVSLSAPTGGRVMMLHPAITNRGAFEEGEVLVEIDASSERAQIRQARASIAATDARLQLINTQLKRQLDLLDDRLVSQSSADDLLGQQAETQANLQGQRAQLAVAEIALENKTIYAPFDGSVQTKEAEIGDVVGGGTPIARVYTDDRMQVTVAVRESDAALLPGLFEGARTKGTISVAFAGVEQTWEAEVERVDPSLDPTTRTLSVTLGLKQRVANETSLSSGAPPALINAFAKVVIDGIQPENTYAIASTALRNGDSVWLYRDSALVVHPATLVHVDGEKSYVEIHDLQPSDRLITSIVASPQPGKALRDVNAESAELSQ